MQHSDHLKSNRNSLAIRFESIQTYSPDTGESSKMSFHCSTIDEKRVLKPEWRCDRNG